MNHICTYRTDGSLYTFEQAKNRDVQLDYTGAFDNVTSAFNAKINRAEYYSWCDKRTLEYADIYSVGAYVKYLISNENGIAKQSSWVPKRHTDLKN